MKDKGFFSREAAFREIKERVELGQNTIITGEKGIGKTWLLEKLHKEFPGSVYSVSRPPSLIVEAIAKKRNIRYKKRRQIDILRDIRNRGLLLIDEMERKTKRTQYILEKLERRNWVFIAAARENNTDFREIKLKELSREESEKLAFSQLKGIKEKRKFAKIIAKKTGNPEKIGSYATLAILMSKKGILDEKKFKKYTKRGLFGRRTIEISRNSLMSLGFLLIALRFLFYGMGFLDLGYWIAAAGYLMYFARSLKR